MAGNGSIDVLVAWLFFIIEVQKSRITWSATTSVAGLEKFEFSSSESVEIYGIWCDPLEMFGDPLEERKQISNVISDPVNFKE